MANEERLPKLVIYGISPNLKNQLCNICKNIGVTSSSFLKTKIRDIVDSYPEEMKKPLKD